MAVVQRRPSAPYVAGAIQRPKVEPEPPGGFRRKATFEELAQTKPPPREQPIRRDAIEYWNSFEGAWLREPIDNIRDKAQEIQTREAIRLLAEKQARDLNTPVPQIMGDLKRQFQRPRRLDADTVLPEEGRGASRNSSTRTTKIQLGPMAWRSRRSGSGRTTSWRRW